MARPRGRLRPVAAAEEVEELTTLGADGRVLFSTRAARLFGYGLISVVLVLYLSSLGLSGGEIGLLLTLTLVGDTVISLWLTTHADRLGRRRVLLFGSLLMLGAGLVFAWGPPFVLLVAAAIVGVISPSGNEVGPFLAVEQASLSEIVATARRTDVFARYNLTGSLATALGALAGGGGARALELSGMAPVDGYRAVVVGYAAVGIVLAALFTRLSPAVEAPRATDASVATRLGLHRSRSVVLQLAALFSIDAFAGGFVIQSVVAYWFVVRFGASSDVLGAIFFGANVLAGFSALVAAAISRRVGLLRTMVYTHVPSNLLLILVPVMPTLPLAVAVLLARFAISQMDVPARQAYTMALVAPDERSGAAGVTGVARTLGAAISPSLAVPLVAGVTLAGLPFVISGVLKLVYDGLVFLRFRDVPVEGEAPR
ncbi:MAG TPA: MFS transporter [Candidatus Limnocylindrales bacterium]|nr:MFS transporter [Candidatus Limnocylindrales bacterium]